MIGTYLLKAWARAGKQAVHWVQPQSLGALLRLGVTFVLAATAAWFFGLRFNLERFGVPSLAAVQDEIAITLLLLYVAVALFVFAFIVALVFVAPYQLWREEATRARLIETAETGNDVLSAWSARDPLTLRQAACLWVGEAPPRDDTDALSERAHVMLLELEEAVRRRGLKVSNPTKLAYEEALNDIVVSLSGEPLARPSSLALRADLLALAELRKEQPAFLVGASDVPIGLISLAQAFRYVGEDSQWSLDCPPLMEVWTESLRRAVHDALSTGRVKAMGRIPGEGGNHSRFGLAAIDTLFWRDAWIGATDQVMEWLDANNVYTMDKGEKKLAYIDVRIDADDLKRAWPPLTPKQRKEAVSPVRRAREANELQRTMSVRPVPQSQAN